MWDSTNKKRTKICIQIRTKEANNMVMEEQIKLGIRLKGRDQEVFKNNLVNPPYTPEGIELVRMAQENARKMRI